MCMYAPHIHGFVLWYFLEILLEINAPPHHHKEMALQTICDNCKNPVIWDDSFTVMVQTRNNRMIADNPEQPLKATARQNLDICPECIQDFKISVKRMNP